MVYMAVFIQNGLSNTLIKLLNFFPRLALRYLHEYYINNTRGPFKYREKQNVESNRNPVDHESLTNNNNETFCTKFNLIIPPLTLNTPLYYPLFLRH